jgi:hypothetical protein
MNRAGSQLFVYNALPLADLIFQIRKEKITMNETKRDVYVQQLKAGMDEWNAEIDKLKAKADQAKAGFRFK